MQKNAIVAILVMVLVPGPLLGIAGGAECAHSGVEICSGEDRALCPHTAHGGEPDGRAPAQEDCPAHHTCSHPCGHLLSSPAGTAPATAVQADSAPMPAHWRGAPAAGFSTSPYRPPKPLS